MIDVDRIHQARIPLVVDALLPIDDAARRTGEPVRRLRQWCATGRIRCERDGRGWLIPEPQVARILAIAAARTVAGSGNSVRALVVPQSSLRDSSLRKQVAAELQIAAETISTRTMTIDGQSYIVATWPSAIDVRGSDLAELADQLDGELLD